MNWHFEEYGAPAGPVDDTDFQKAVEVGRIKDDTLVWHKDLPNWTEFRNVKSTFQVTLPLPDAIDTCVRCGRAFRIAAMSQLNGRWFCTGCKPKDEQKPAGPASAEMVFFQYGGFWRRVIAACLDTCLLHVALTPVRTAVAEKWNTGLSGGDLVALIGLGWFISLCYTVLTTWLLGGSLGKLLTGMRVVHPDGSRIGFGTALMRFFANLLSGMLLGLGYVMVGVDDEKRALHDRICNTRVVIPE